MSTAQDDTQLVAPSALFGGTFFAEPPEPVQIQLGAATHAGLVRGNNEDHYAVVRRTRSQELLLSNLPAGPGRSFHEHAYMMIVADGMGGAAFGELASQMVIEAGWELAGRATSWVMRLTDVDAQQVQERVNAYAQRIEEFIQEHSTVPGRGGMGSTWTGAYVMGRDVVIAHVGDSRVYRFRDGLLKQITQDHTLAEELIRTGLAPESAKNFGHVLTNCFGGGTDEVIPELHHLRLEDGDRLLLCTDGLTGMAADEEITEVLADAESPQRACDALVDLALKHGGKDNVTVVVAAITSEQPE